MTRPDGPARGDRLVASACAAWYRALLVFYPRGFRDEHGREATELFADACRESWREHGVWAVLLRVAAALRDVPRDGLRERRSMASAVRGIDRSRGRPLAELAQDLGHAVRSLWHRPGLTIAIVTTLALGIGANTAMFSVVDATLLRPLPYPHPDRVVYVRARSVETGTVRDPTAEELQRWAPLVDSLERVEGRGWQSVLLTGPEGATRVRMLGVTGGYLGALSARPIVGRLLLPDDARPDAAPVVVLSQTLWRNRYGARTEIVGEPIRIDGISRVVVGVVPDIASDVPGLRFSLYAPLPSSGPAARETTVRGVAWLRPGVSLEAARAAFRSAAASVDEKGHRSTGELQTPTNVFWNSRELRDPQLAMMGAVFLLLAIAIVNVANLLLAAGQRRRGELAVRRALGASRFRIARLLLVESLVLALAGSAAGLVLARTGIALFTALDPGNQMQTRLEAVRLDGLILGYAVAIAFVTGLIFGVVPALRGSATPLNASLRETDQRAGSRLGRLPGLLMATEVALSLVLLVVAGLVCRAFWQMRFADSGFAADRVLTVRITLPEWRYPTPARQAAFFDDLVARTAQLPGVIGTTLGYGATPPTDFVAMGAVEIEGQLRSAADTNTMLSFVSPGYFELVGIPLVAGRGFDASHLSGAGAVIETPAIISRGFARRFWPDGNPVDAGFGIAGPQGIRRYRVIGVAGDVKSHGLLSPKYGQMYLPLMAKRRYTDVLLRLADGAPPPLAGLQAAINAVDPDVPADDSLETAAASLNRFINLPRFRAALFGSFAVLAVILVGFGLFAVIAHAVSQRSREMGIRLALGARPSQVRRLIVLQGMRPTLVGIGLGLVIATAVTRTMTSYLYGIGATDLSTFIATSVLIAAVALGAILAPALRATRVNPVETLRSE